MHGGSGSLRLNLLLATWSTISAANILTDVPKSNPLNIDWDPAPSPEDGPPISAHASRNKALLPAQISGIVGAYLFSICVIGVLVLALNRRRRERIEGIHKIHEIEMVTGYYEQSPISPNTLDCPRNFSWPSPDRKEPAPYVFPNSVRDLGLNQPRSPPGHGDPYVDTRVVEADREMLQRDLEDIYAHVMEQEAAKAAGVKLKEMPLPARLQTVGPVPTTAPQRRPSPPKKIEKNRPANLTIQAPESPKTQSRTSSIISALKSPRKKGLRAMRISSPIPTPLSSTFPQSQEEDEEPLSPRYYAPPPPPPIPRDQVPYTHSRNNSQGPSPISPTRSIAEQLNSYPPTRYQHQPNPSHASMQSQSTINDPVSATSATSQTPLVAPSFPLSPPRPRHGGPTTSNPPSTNSSTRALPLRQFEPALASPSFSHSTKTTVLERTTPLSPGGPRTGGMKSPWSPGAVPYSPYQPFTPMMPITPTLVTKEQRKRMKKIEPRTPVLEMVMSSDELWDSGY